MVTPFGRNKYCDDEIKKTNSSLSYRFAAINKIRKSEELLLDEVKKKHSRTSPDVQFNKLSLTKLKIRPKTDYE